MSKVKTIKTLANLSFIGSILLTFAGCTTLPKSENQSMINPVEMTLNFYQNYISPVDGHRCQMYPSCSEYSRQAFKKHGFLKGIILTSDRLLRCGRNEMTTSPQIVRNGMKYCDDSLEKNDFWWYSDNTSPGSM